MYVHRRNVSDVSFAEIPLSPQGSEGTGALKGTPLLRTRVLNQRLPLHSKAAVLEVSSPISSRVRFRVAIFRSPRRAGVGPGATD